MLLWLGVCRQNVVAKLITVFPDNLLTGANPGFFKGVGRGGYIGTAESMEHVPKLLGFENLNLTETASIDILPMPHKVEITMKCLLPIPPHPPNYAPVL